MPANWQLFSLILFLGLILGFLLRDAPFLGYDWYYLFQRYQPTNKYFPPWIYPPWTDIVLFPLAKLPWRMGLSLVNGISIMTVGAMTYLEGRRKSHRPILAMFLAIFSLQLSIALWLGHIDGLALLGILALPFTIPLVLMKGTFIGFAVITRKTWFLAALAFILITLVAWPAWPKELISTLDLRNSHPAAGGWRKTGFLPAALGFFLLLKTKRDDLYQTLAAGAIMYPFMLPYHFIILLPALGALRGLRLILAWIAAQIMIAPFAFETFSWTYFVFPIAIWYFRFTENEPRVDWISLIWQKKEN